MSSILEIISLLKEKRDILSLDREVNMIEIRKCEQLIQYYISHYNSILKSINRKRENLDLYDAILDIKERFDSQKWLEELYSRFIDEKRDLLVERIEELTAESYEIRDSVVFYQRKKLGLESIVSEIDEKLLCIDEGIKHPNSSLESNGYVKKIVLKG